MDKTSTSMATGLRTVTPDAPEICSKRGARLLWVGKDQGRVEDITFVRLSHREQRN